MIAIAFGLPIGLSAVFVRSHPAHVILLFLTGTLLAVALGCFAIAAVGRAT